MLDLKVRAWMSQDVETIDPRTSVGIAEQMMRRRGVRRLPVIGGERLVGIVTLGDLREARPSPATSLSRWEIASLRSRVEVRHVMSRDVITIGPEDTVLEAAETMLQRKIGGLPVLDEGRLVGIITESDIFRVLVRLVRELQPAD